MGQPAQDGQGSEILENIQVTEGYADKTLNDNMCNDNFFFLPQEFLLEAPFLHSWDFTVFFTTASTSHLNGHPSKC